MTVVFLTNFLTHHQTEFCNCMHKCLGDDFAVAVMRSADPEQKKLGYQELNDMYPYVIKTYESKDEEQRAMELCERADVAIWGSAPAKYTQSRLKQNKLTLIYTERLFKKGKLYALYPPVMRYMYHKFTAQRKKQQYYLCASGYTAGDINLFTHTPRKFFKWGYFPETKRYQDIDNLIDKKIPRSIVWVARYIDWKHPEIPLEIGRRLKNDGYNVTIRMLGNGELLENITQKVAQQGLEDTVHIIGAVPSDRVRTYMENAEIHLFTSDRNEGWGAVLNESMNSACAVIANRSIGAVPFLIKDGINGLTYTTANELYEKITFLLDHPDQRKSMAKCAYATITEEWNADFATKRLLKLLSQLLSGDAVDLPQSGPCSIAKTKL